MKQPKLITADEIKALIRESIEPLEPQTTILAVLTENDGKPLTERHAKIMRERTGDDSIRITKRHQTYIEWGYVHHGVHGMMYIDGETKNVVINAAFIRERNDGYFGAAEHRNTQRETLLRTEATVKEFAILLKNYRAAQAKLVELLDGRLEVVKYQLQEAVGEKLDPKHRRDY